MFLCLPERLASVLAVLLVLVLRGAPIPSLLVVAVLVVVPLGLSACAVRPVGIERSVGPWLLPAGFLAAISLCLPSGPVAAMAAVPWLLACSLLALGAVIDRVRFRDVGFGGLGDSAARCFVPIGAAWLVASRLGLQPMGFVEPIVLLTAIHFHFAGFTAPILVARGLQRFGVAGRSRRVLQGALLGSVVGPWVLAAGFVISPALKLVAVAVIGSSLVALAVIALASLGSMTRKSARVLLAASSISVLLGMTLALVYAIGEYTGKWWLLIGHMERTHGWIQGVGFALLGLSAWRLEHGKGPDTFRFSTPGPGELRQFAIDHRERPLSYDPARIGGWWRNHGQRVVGHGPADFRAAQEAVLALRMFPMWTAVAHDGDSFEVRLPDRGRDPSPISLGSMVVVGARMFRLIFAQNACRVVRVIDEAQQAGFHYGTVEGHLMRGEESFLVRMERDGRVVFEIESFSRAGHPLSFLVLPIVRRLQRRFVVDALPRIEVAVRGDAGRQTRAR